MSPVWSQPWTSSTRAVSSGSPKYARMIPRPRRRISPSSANETSIPGIGMPTVPQRLRSGRLLTVIAVDSERP